MGYTAGVKTGDDKTTRGLLETVNTITPGLAYHAHHNIIIPIGLSGIEVRERKRIEGSTASEKDHPRPTRLLPERPNRQTRTFLLQPLVLQRPKKKNAFLGEAEW